MRCRQCLQEDKPDVRPAVARPDAAAQVGDARARNHLAVAQVRERRRVRVARRGEDLERVGVVVHGEAARPPGLAQPLGHAATAGEELHKMHFGDDRAEKI